MPFSLFKQAERSQLCPPRWVSSALTASHPQAASPRHPKHPRAAQTHPAAPSCSITHQRPSSNSSSCSKPPLMLCQLPSSAKGTPPAQPRSTKEAVWLLFALRELGGNLAQRKTFRSYREDRDLCFAALEQRIKGNLSVSGYSSSEVGTLLVGCPSEESSKWDLSPCIQEERSAVYICSLYLNKMIWHLGEADSVQLRKCLWFPWGGGGCLEKKIISGICF